MKKKTQKNVYVPLTVVLLYSLYYYFLLTVITERGMLIGLNDITGSNVGERLLLDVALMLILPGILIIIYRKKLKDFSLRITHSNLLILLVSIVLLLFVLHNDYTVSGFYQLFFHLIIVAFGEEFIFRGYFYNVMKRQSKTFAVLVSGILWGSMHAILPGLAAGEPLSAIGLNMVSQMGFGIAAGYYFIYLMEKSDTLLVPILVHAILNYTVGPIGVITAFGTGVYFMSKQSSLNRKVIRSKEISQKKAQ